ncbi:MAG: hypothetical protein QM775_34555 [Pirellulales bacterium]
MLRWTSVAKPCDDSPTCRTNGSCSSETVSAPISPPAVWSKASPGRTPPSDLQIVSLAAPQPENAWVADLHAVDGAAAPGADAEFVAVIRYEGEVRRPAVQAGFHVDGVLVQSRVVDLEPGQRRELSFVHRFEAGAESTGPRFGVVRVELSDDRLPDDNHREVVVPILPSLNVLYVSQDGPSDQTPEAAAGRGLWIQRLLAPVVERGDVQPKLANHARRRRSCLSRGFCRKLASRCWPVCVRPRKACRATPCRCSAITSRKAASC